jgi:hypothetical protein
MQVVVYLHLALICFSGRCYPALVGRDTPTGAFSIQKRIVLAEGYGGDVLQFSENDDYIFAIHRVWLGRPAEHRLERLQSSTVAMRQNVTGGCINVLPEVYDLLQGKQSLLIEP